MLQGQAMDKAQLRQLAAQELTAREIGIKLGVTRNAVLGACHRLGIAINSRPSTNGVNLKKKEAELLALPPPSPALLRLAKHCKVAERCVAERLGLDWEPPVTAMSAGGVARRGDY